MTGRFAEWQVPAMGRAPEDTSEMPGWGQLHQCPAASKHSGAKTLSFVTPSLCPLWMCREPMYHLATLGTLTPAASGGHAGTGGCGPRVWVRDVWALSHESH